MSLLTSYTDANKRVTQQLETHYQWYYDETSKSAPFYRVDRVRTKRYSYVGMDATTAASCVVAKDSLYKRLVQEWVWDEMNHRWVVRTSAPVYSQQMMAEITEVNRDGGMWNVEISVNETVSWYGQNLPEDLDTAFRNIYGTWNYD